MEVPAPPAPPATRAPRVIGRYALYDDIASGGMATVHVGRLVGPVGFSRTVAIKRLHPQFAKDPEFVAMFLDEARLAARIQHPNVVPTLDVVATEGELFLVMEYVRGESVSHLSRAAKAGGEPLPPRIVAAIISGALQGLHAAHEAKDEAGQLLGIVHRDISPQNVLVGLDGTARVLDFGVAKAEDKFHATRDGQLKGKVLYMPPEQLEGHDVDRTADTYSMGVVLFEMLTGKRMFASSKDKAELAKILRNEITLPSAVDPALSAWDAVVGRACKGKPSERYATAKAMAHDVEKVVGVASASEVAEWVERLAGAVIQQRTRRIAELESSAQLDRANLHAALADELARSPASGPIAPPSGSQISHVSQVSQISQASQPSAASQYGVPVSHRPPEAQPRRVGLWVGVGAGALALVALAFFVGRLGTRREEPRGTAQGPSASAVVTTATATTNATNTSAATGATTATPPATGAAEPAASVRGATASAATTSAATAKPVVSASAKPAHTAARTSCDPPYTLDSSGHKHFKPECL